MAIIPAHATLVYDGAPGAEWKPIAGNPGEATQPPPGKPEKQPGNAYGGDSSGKVSALGVGQESAWRGGADFAMDNTITRDRHVLVKTGPMRTGISPSVPGNPPNPDSLPARPLFAFVNRSLNPQQGSDNTANQDDLTRGYARNKQGMYLGEQGSGWTPVYGGVPGLYQPYGSYAGYTARETKGIQSPVEHGAVGDGPHKVFSGPPHGLHSPTLPSYDNTLGRYMAIPQMHAPRVDRPANSNIAGQDYSQTVVPQGQVGTVAQNPVRFQSSSRFGVRR